MTVESEDDSTATTTTTTTTRRNLHGQSSVCLAGWSKRALQIAGSDAAPNGPSAETDAALKCGRFTEADDTAKQTTTESIAGDTSVRRLSNPRF